jgi:hypothetical protein
MTKKILISALLLAGLFASCGKPGPEAVILSPAGSGSLERLAAAELRRYLYLRTNELVPIADLDSLPEGKKLGLLVALKGQPSLAGSLDESTRARADALGEEEYLIRTIASPSRTLVLIVGGGPTGVLYGAYRYIGEGLGVGFYLDGDVIPDSKIPLGLPAVNLRAKPLFQVRGIQPFHDFPEGPDWWNADEYKAVLAQLPKLGMNFIGLHTYPEGRPNAEPTVWIGPPGSIEPDGRVAAAYPSSWQNTLRGNWGYEARKTGGFHFGASRLFEEDAYGPEVMRGLMPEPRTPEDAVALFNRAGLLLTDVFSFAARLGVQTCLGTETPLTVPARVKEDLRARGLNPNDPRTVEDLYRGIFKRLAKLSPPDHYWLWTTESWTWSDAGRSQVRAVAADLGLAVRAARELNVPFRLATCGWVLGPPSERNLFDRILPKEVAISCINREVGKAPVDVNFARIEGRSKWAIPWLEDDPALTSPQLWAGRMRRDASDALAYGCDGLLGIHWRTRILSPNIGALAEAAWRQTWNPDPTRSPSPPGPQSGVFVSFPGQEIKGTSEPAVYRDARDRVFGYHLPVPNGRYALTLKFCEGQVGKRGQRVFDVWIEGRKALEKLDLYEAAGRFTAIDFNFFNLEVGDGRLDIDFLDRIGYPCLSGLVVRGARFSKKINCGGPAVLDYEADWPETPRFAPVDDFYRDWAIHQFGTEANPEIGALFARLDGHLPIPVDWVGGPGGLKPDPRAWTEAAPEYAFVDTLAQLRPSVQGPGSLERFDYWLNSFRYLRAVAHLDCLAAEYDRERRAALALEDGPARQKAARDELLPLRRKIAAAVKEVYDYLLPTVGSTGELGTVANWEQHILPGLVEIPGRELESLLGAPLPPEAWLGQEYDGPPRLFVLTCRTSALPGESLRLRVIALARQEPEEALLRWRTMGRGRFETMPLVPLARGVYQAQLPPLTEDIEYYLQARFERSDIRFPATAPDINQTVVVIR